MGMLYRIKAIKRGTKKDAMHEDEKTRLSTMTEEDELEPVTIKVGLNPPVVPV